MNQPVNSRLSELLSGLPESAALTTLRLRKQLMETIPGCHEAYRGGRKAGVSTYRMGAEGPLCCTVQARPDAVRLFLAVPVVGPGGASPEAKSRFTLRVDESVDLKAILDTVEESVRVLRRQHGRRLAG